MSSSFAGRIEEARRTLGLPPLVTFREIRQKYRSLAKKAHPDRGGDEEQMRRIAEAYAVLESYINNYRFRLDEQEALAQYPFESHNKQFHA